MKRTICVAAGLAVVSILLTGCSLSSLLPSTKIVGAGAEPTATPAPAVAPLTISGTTGFDNHAGNCLNAANEAIALINKAASRTDAFASTPFTMDMRLDLDPHGASCANQGPDLKHYQDFVSSAHLNVWALDAMWINVGPQVRSQWLADTLDALRAVYPRATVTIDVFSSTYNMACGTAFIGPGTKGGRTIQSC